MKNSYYWIWLSRLNLKPIVAKKLLDTYKKPENIWNLNETDLLKQDFSKKTIEKILNKRI